MPISLLFITDALNPEEQDLSGKHGTIMLNHYDQASLLQATYSLENTPARAVIVLTNQSEVAFNYFNLFLPIYKPVVG